MDGSHRGNGINVATHELLTGKKELCDCLHRALGSCDTAGRDTHLLADKLKRPALREVHTSVARLLESEREGLLVQIVVVFRGGDFAGPET